ncbi:MAG: hypothetical protein WC069_05900 [Candidatus Shapirobacteria bacterium]
MKHHPKIYEDVFSRDHLGSNHKLNLDKISVGPDLELTEYTSLFKNFLNKFYEDIFDGYVRVSWLRRKFSYCNIRTVFPMYKNTPIVNLAFVKFVRRIIGKDLQIVTRTKTFSKIETYFSSLFPGFLEGNPFTNPEYYKFPYKHITLDFLFLVHQLDDRMELLDVAEKEKMSFAVFMDYIINYVSTENDLLPKPRFVLKQNYDKNAPFYIRDNKKDLQVKKGKKRK